MPPASSALNNVPKWTPTRNAVKTRHKEHFKMNRGYSESYRMSAIPFIQRKFNAYVSGKEYLKNHMYHYYALIIVNVNQMLWFDLSQ